MSLEWAADASRVRPELLNHRLVVFADPLLRHQASLFAALAWAAEGVWVDLGGWHACQVPPLMMLIHSPFLGPATWQPAARVLEAEGRPVRVPDLSAVARSAPPYWPQGRDAIVRSAAEDPVVLVAHSNAGLFVPTIIETLGEQVRGVAFVDAALPGAGHHSTSDFLRRLPTVDGLLPPWTSWWDDADVAALFPDPAVRAAVEAEQPRMPLAYYDHLPPAPEGWAVPPCAYMWFGPPYDQGARQAARNRWPTTHLPGGHLHMLVDPGAVAAAVLTMAGAWD